MYGEKRLDIIRTLAISVTGQHILLKLGHTKSIVNVASQKLKLELNDFFLALPTHNIYFLVGDGIYSRGGDRDDGSGSPARLMLEDPFLETADRCFSAKSAGDNKKFIQALHKKRTIQHRHRN